MSMATAKVARRRARTTVNDLQRGCRCGAASAWSACYGLAMVMSTITRHNTRWDAVLATGRLGVGRELRRRRLAAGVSQAALGNPLTRAYVSAVETGRVVPSLPALDHMVTRLGTSLSDFFAAVERDAGAGSSDG